MLNRSVSLESIAVHRPSTRDNNWRSTIQPWNSLTFATLCEPWRELTTTGICGEPFFQPEWFEAYRSTIEPDAECLLLTVKQDETLTGVIPLVRSDTFFQRIPAATLRSLSNVHSCRFDLVHDGSATREVAGAAWAALKEHADWEVIEALDVPPEGNFRTLLELAAADGFLVGTWPTRKMPFLPLSTDPKNPFAPCPAAFKGSRSRLKSKLNKLAKEGQIQFSLSHAAKPELLNAFFALEASGWKGANGSAIVRNPKLVNFYTQIAKVAEQSGTLRLYSLDLNGKPVAMHFGLLQNGTYSIPKVAYDEARKKCSPGLLLMKHVLEELTSQGMRCFDFLGPRMEWKCMWTALFKEHAHCYIFRPTLKGRLLHAASMRLAPKLRELKYRWRGDPQAVEIKAE